MYFKNTLDKLGVHVDVEHAGKYKDYGDQFTKTSMSPETSEVMSSLADEIYGDLINTVAKGRGKDPAAVRALIDSGPFLAKQAKANGLVDELRYEDEAFGELAATLHQKNIEKVTEQTYMDVPDRAAGLNARDRIAFVVGEGSISRDAGITNGTGLFSETFDKTLARVGNDSSVKGVIVRIDSPGGEVAASDDMWRAMNQLHRKKPVVISMSDDAASGGYYMAMSGDPVIAEPATITGSIGVVFGKPDLHGLYDKIGITKDFVSRGKFALIESDYQPLSEAERAKLREGIDSDYEDFLSKVAAARRKPVSAAIGARGAGARLARRSGEGARSGGRARRPGSGDRDDQGEIRHRRGQWRQSGSLSAEAQSCRRALPAEHRCRGGFAALGSRPGAVAERLARCQSASLDARRHVTNAAIFDSIQVTHYRRVFPLA